MKHPIAKFVKRFFGHYLPVQKGLSANTILAYRDAIKLMLCYVADTLKQSVDELTVEAVDETIVLNFLDHIELKRGCTPRTRNARLAAIRSLFAFIAREDPILLVQCQKIRSIPLKRTIHKTVEYLEEPEMQALLASVNIDSRTGIRDKALLLFLYNTGARASEIVGLALDDLHLDRSPRIRLLGKGNKERNCPLWTETVDALADYIDNRQAKDPTTTQLFLNANGDPITRFGIRYVTRKYGVRAQTKQPSLATKPVNPHCIRHTAAMHLLRAGNDINMISFWLGHASINTTHIYVEIDMETKRKMLDKAGAPLVDDKVPWQQPDILEWLHSLARSPQLCSASC